MVGEGLNKAAVGSENAPEARDLNAAYATGFFSLSLVPMTFLLVPLWALSLDISASMIGIAVASRSLLPFFLSIHGGAMMDRLGTRRTTLFFTVSGAVLSLLYPLLPWIGSLIALQLLVGLAQGMGWIGAQTKIARMTRGNPKYTGRFSFITTLGTFVGPLLVGLAWDAGGAWGGFSLIAMWGACLSFCVYRLPASARSQEPRQPRFGLRDLAPKMSDYVQAFAMLSIPGVALVIVVTFLRLATISVQGSFYTVYLAGIGLSGTRIGMLVGLSALIGSLAALSVGPVTKRVTAHWALLIATAISIVAICVTPLLESFTALLIAAGIFGIGIGVGLPMLLTILADATSRRGQGMSVGLRTTANRLASFVVPLSMGFVVEFFGIHRGFLVVAIMLLLILSISAVIVRRSAAFATGAKTPTSA